jgi:hypothetical protein
VLFCRHEDHYSNCGGDFLVRVAGRHCSKKKDTVSVSDLHGNDLLRFCSSREPYQLNFCTGYIEGIRDGLMFAALRLKSEPFFVVPNEAKSDQLKDIVVKYLKDNPETRHKPAGLLIFLALERAFSRQA